MGIRFNTSTWRSPLLLIDSWLPLAPETPAKSRKLPLALQRFARAGWLGKVASMDTFTAARNAPSAHAAVRPPCRVRVPGNRELKNGHPGDARLVISGRLGDVCAELDRLAALENPAVPPHV